VHFSGGVEEAMKTLVGIDSVLAKICSECHQNTSLELYHYSSPLGRKQQTIAATERITGYFRCS
jgi:hypothetical protein